MGWSNARGWLKFELASIANQALIIQIDNPIFNEFTFFVFENGKELLRENGLQNSRLPELQFLVENNKKYLIYIAAKAQLNPLKFPIRIIPQHQYAKFEAHQTGKTGLIVGFLIILVLLNLLVAYFFRIRIFVFLAFNAFSFVGLYLYLNGFLFDYLDRKSFENQWINVNYLIYFSFLIISLVFPWALFKLQISQYRFFRISYILLLVWSIILAIIFLFFEKWLLNFSENNIRNMSYMIRISSLINQIFVLAILVKLFRKVQLASWFLAAIIPPMLSFTAPRFFNFALSGLWLTQSDLIVWALVWYIIVLSFGFMIYLSQNYAVKNIAESKFENQPLPKEINEDKKLEINALHKENSVLSKRETEILLAYSNGFSYQEISDAFFISPHTVRTHIKNIYQK